MKKYLRVVKNTWEEMLTYRLNFFVWRIRSVVFILTFYFLWAVIIPKNGELFGYTQSQMLTYILGTSLLSAIVVSSRSHSIGEDINTGTLSNYLIKPMSYFGYYFSKDLGDKAMNMLFSIIELIGLFLLLQPPLFLQTNSVSLFLFFVTIGLGLILFFFFNVLLGLIGFWSNDVWAPRFIFFMTLNFFAGIYFPLDILPASIYAIYQLLPFPYLLYFPIKIYLGTLSFPEIFIGICITSFWIFIMYFVVKAIWRKGLVVYTAEGR